MDPKLDPPKLKVFLVPYSPIELKVAAFLHQESQMDPKQANHPADVRNLSRPKLTRRYYKKSKWGWWDWRLWVRPGFRLGVAMVPHFKDDFEKLRDGWSWIVWIGPVLIDLNWRQRVRTIRED